MSDLQVTAESFIQRAVTAAAEHARNTLTGSETPEQTTIRIHALIGHFQAVALMEQLRRTAPEVADSMAVWLTDVLDAGDTVHELAWQWNADLAAGHPLTAVGPKPDEPDPPADAVPVLVPAVGGPTGVLGMPVTVPGLQVVQAIRRSHTGTGNEPMAGLWSILHVPSGHTLHRNPYPLDTALGLATSLGEIVDWTLPGEEIIALLAVGSPLQDQFAEIFARMEGCRYHTDADHLPQRPWRALATAGAVAG